MHIHFSAVTNNFQRKWEIVSISVIMYYIAREKCVCVCVWEGITVLTFLLFRVELCDTYREAVHTLL